MKKQNRFAATLEVMKALSVPWRLQILVKLRERGRMNLSQITDELEVVAESWRASPSTSNVCEHLQFLKRAGLIRSTRVKRSVYWELRGPGVGRALRGIERMARLLGPRKPDRRGTRG